MSSDICEASGINTENVDVIIIHDSLVKYINEGIMRTVLGVRGSNRIPGDGMSID